MTALSSTSRYRSVSTAMHTGRDGRTVEYLRRRFIPHYSPHGALQVRSRAGDRVDLLASRVLSDPQLYWHVLDTNPAFRRVHGSVEPDVPSDSALVILRLPGSRP